MRINLKKFFYLFSVQKEKIVENGLIISIKRVILIPSKFTSKFAKKDLGRVVTAKTPKTRINTDFFAIFSLCVFVSRKILIQKHKKSGACFSQNQKPENPHKYWAFGTF